MIGFLLSILLICVIIYIFDSEVTFSEFLAIFMSVLLVCGILRALALFPVNNSYYFVSGRLVSVTHYPRFVEQYLKSHTVCTSSGKSTTCRTYFTTERAVHPEHWKTTDSFGRSWKISQEFFNQMRSEFGNPEVEVRKPFRCSHGGHPVSGDSKAYSYSNWNYFGRPVSQRLGWHNPLLNSHSIFLKDRFDVLDYPDSDGMYSNTRISDASGLDFTAQDWDKFNSKLYQDTQLNANLIKIDSPDKCQEIDSDWMHGGKNDVNICIVGDYSSPNFVYVSGWGITLYGAKELESEILMHGVIKSKLEDYRILISKHKDTPDFSRYKYLNHPIPKWYKILELILSFIVGAYVYGTLRLNDMRKEED